MGRRKRTALDQRARARKQERRRVHRDRYADKNTPGGQQSKEKDR